MPITAADLRPAKALGPIGGTRVPTLTFMAGSAVALGDLVVMQADGKVDADNAIVAGDVQDIVGLVNETAVDTDVVVVACALPGVRFEANLTQQTTDTDLTATLANIGDEVGIAEEATFMVLNTEGAANTLCARVISFARQIDATQTHTPFTAPTQTNPRCEFVFVNSFFFTDDVQ